MKSHIIAYTLLALFLPTRVHSQRIIAYDFRNGPIIAPNGYRFFNGAGIRTTGDMWPYVGPAFNQPFGESVGFVNEVCTRLNDVRYYLCQGTYENLFEWSGKLSFTGTYDDQTQTGEYTIIGGTEDFIYDRGYITDRLDPGTGFNIRSFYFQR